MFVCCCNLLNVCTFPALQKGQIIQIISKNDTGMWRGVCNNRIGTFKFINVDVLGDESPRVTPTRQRRQRIGRRQRARNVQELLEKLDLKVLTLCIPNCMLQRIKLLRRRDICEGEFDCARG